MKTHFRLARPKFFSPVTTVSLHSILLTPTPSGHCDHVVGWKMRVGMGDVGRGKLVLYFSLVCGLCSVCYKLFVIDRLNKLLLEQNRTYFTVAKYISGH